MNAFHVPIVRFLALHALAGAAMAQAQTLQPLQDVARAAESHLAARLNVPGGNAVAHVTAGAIDARLRLPLCTLPLEGVMPSTVRESARMTIGVRCTQPTWTVYVPVSIETEMPVLVLRQAAARGASVGEGDVERVTRRVPGIASTYLTDPAQLERRHLRNAAGPGTALTQDLLAADVLIRRGQRVTLVASAGGIEVRAQGEAVADATANGRVRVLNLSSRRIVEGQVETPDQVRVSL